MTTSRLMTRKQTSTLSDRRRRIYDFLRHQHTGVLSTVTPDNNPHGTVVYYVIDEDFTIHLLTKSGTRKHDNLLHNNHIMLTVYNPATQTIAQVLGVALEQADSEAVNTISNRLFKRLVLAGSGQLPPIVKLQAGVFTTFAIKPVQIRMAVYVRPDPGDYDELFESIESFDLNIT